jgi:hypothetical protein
MSTLEDMTNKDLIEYCKDEGIDVDSKNVSKPTKKELLAAIKAFEQGQAEPEEVTEVSDEEIEDEGMTDADEFLNMLDEPTVETKKESTAIKTKKLSRAQKRRLQYNEYMPLKRVLVTTNADNQTKTSLVFITWGNGLLGHRTDRVYLGKPWHVRQGALNNMKAAFTAISIQDEEGNQVKSETLPTYNIIELDALTKNEIETIKKRQIIRDASIESLV